MFKWESVELFGYKNFMVSMLTNDINAITIHYEIKELPQIFKMQDRQIVYICLCGICDIFWVGFKTKECLNYIYIILGF